MTIAIKNIEVELGLKWFWYPDWESDFAHYFGFVTIYVYSK